MLPERCRRQRNTGGKKKQWLPSPSAAAIFIPGKRYCAGLAGGTVDHRGQCGRFIFSTVLLLVTVCTHKGFFHSGFRFVLLQQRPAEQREPDLPGSVRQHTAAEAAGHAHAALIADGRALTMSTSVFICGTVISEIIAHWCVWDSPSVGPYVANHLFSACRFNGARFSLNTWRTRFATTGSSSLATALNASRLTSRRPAAGRTGAGFALFTAGIILAAHQRALKLLLYSPRRTFRHGNRFWRAERTAINQQRMIFFCLF